MTIRQRNTVLALAGALVILLVLVVVTRNHGHGHGAKVAAGVAPVQKSTSTTADTAPPTTPVSLAPVTSPPPAASPPTTAAPPATTAGPPPTTVPPTTAPPARPATTTSTTAAPGQAVNGKGAVLQPPSKPVSKPYNGDCTGLVDEGWSKKDCGTAANLVWLIETKPSGASRTYVYRTGVPATADEVLEAPDDDANSFTAVKAVVADVAGDGHQEVAFGFHQQGSGGILAVDLVGADGSVVVHRDYGGGSAKAQKGQLDGWGSDSPSTGPYTHEVIEYRSAAWRIVSTATTSTAPAGNL